jgi:Holliday junction resolvasome RuvABC DNA-binding subunit
MKALKIVEDLILKQVNPFVAYFRYAMLSREEQELFHELMEVNGLKIFGKAKGE